MYDLVVVDFEVPKNDFEDYDMVVMAMDHDIVAVIN